eukprot:6182456-Pleurochrysis_carterae.AAC.3
MQAARPQPQPKSKNTSPAEKRMNAILPLDHELHAHCLQTVAATSTVVASEVLPGLCVANGRRGQSHRGWPTSQGWRAVTAQVVRCAGQAGRNDDPCTIRARRRLLCCVIQPLWCIPLDLAKSGPRCATRSNSTM